MLIIPKLFQLFLNFLWQVRRDPKEKQDVEKAEEETRNDTSGAEQQGVGQADKPESDTKEGHSSTQSDISHSQEKGHQKQKRRLKPGESDTNRALGKMNSCTVCLFYVAT